MKVAAACSLLIIPNEETCSQKHITGWYVTHHITAASFIQESYSFAVDLDTYLGGEGLKQTCINIHLKTFDAADIENLHKMIYKKHSDNKNEFVPAMLTYL